MLAKVWKKVALAICIVAILFNITHKLITKTSLKAQLQSVLGGEAISFSENNSSEEETEGNIVNVTNSSETEE